jgi:hypothetical protein
MATANLSDLLVLHFSARRKASAQGAMGSDRDSIMVQTLPSIPDAPFPGEALNGLPLLLG